MYFFIGSQLLNQCPKIYSCGGYNAIWTDQPMPKDVGKRTIITAYVSQSTDFTTNCKKWGAHVEVIRCSLTDHDFIYRYMNTAYDMTYLATCSFVFCSMN